MNLQTDTPWLQRLNDALNQQVDLGRLHHGLLIEGCQGLGKYEFARHYAQRLLCSQPVNQQACQQCKKCHLFATGAHPDYMEINDPEARSIGVDVIRSLVVKSQKTSQLSGALIFVIRDCDKMTESAANALLKTLEEPNKNTYIILTTSAITHLLPTILSRCQLYKVNSPSIAELAPWLAHNQLDSEDFNLVYQDMGQAPLKAKHLLTTDYLAERSAYLANFKQLLAKKSDAFTFAANIKEENIYFYYVWLMQALAKWMKVKAKKADELSVKPELLIHISDLYLAVQKNYAQSQLNGINKKLNYQQLCHKIEQIQQA